MAWLGAWRQRAKALRMETHALYIAMRDPRTPWYAKVLALCVVCYAISPIDLIPDPIPVLGYLDDLILVPLGIALVRRLVPQQVLVESRLKAAAGGSRATILPWVGAAAIALIWLGAAIGMAYAAWRYLAPR